MHMGVNIFRERAFQMERSFSVIRTTPTLFKKIIKRPRQIKEKDENTPIPS